MHFPTWNLFSFPQMTRTTAAVTLIAITTVLTIVGGTSYYSYQHFFPHPHQTPAFGLHRSNAVRRRRRSHVGTDGNTHDADENADLPNVDPETLRILHDGVTAESSTIIDEWFDDPAEIPGQQRAGQNIVSLLFRVSEDNARRNACVHRGCACNACGTVPIRGIRYRCANCADFDLCETCEAQGQHNKTHIFYKVKVPAPPFGPRSMQPVWYPGDPDQCRPLLKHLIPKLSRETGFERPELDAFWEQWTFMANTEWRDDPDELTVAMDRKTFERCLAPSGGYKHAAPNLIHDRMFAFYDSNHDGLIGFTEFLYGLSYRKRKDKLKKIFEGYDIDGDGYVNRRDFLRMFRAYYVLYKQMHRDILEGLDDQVMSSSEAQQLVAGRQPLSGLFGRENRVPNGDPSRPVEGKLYERNGDVHITDGRERAVNEDTQDTAPRDEILSGLFSREPPRMQLLTYELTSRPRRDSNPNYWEGLIDTPRQVSDLPQLLVGESRQLQDIFNQVAAVMEGGDSDFDNMQSSDEENRDASRPSGQRAVNNGLNNTRVVTNGASTSRESTAEGQTEPDPNDNDAWATIHAGDISNIRERLSRTDRRKRAVARRHLHERWKRRQFYLDEEEGGRAPDDWQSDEDVLIKGKNHNIDCTVGENSKAPQRPPLSPRSRSSSKVRFAEDTCADDYETRSNPSTSSRSVPERWGGFDIPEAERDAGKEILYQVTQQAFNELLDVIFKEKEDLAVKCAETLDERNIWRPLFKNIDLEAEDGNSSGPGHDGSGGERGGGNTHEDTASEQQHDRHQTRAGVGAVGSDDRVDDPFTSETRNFNLGDRPMERILSDVGYTLSLPGSENSNMANVNPVEDNEDQQEEVVEHPPSLDSLEHMGSEAIDGDNAHRDPTLPQFRPNCLADIRPQAHFAERATVLFPGSQTTTVAILPDSPPTPSQEEVESPVLPSGSHDADSEYQRFHHDNHQHRLRHSRQQDIAIELAKKAKTIPSNDRPSGSKDKGKRAVGFNDVFRPSRATLVEFKRHDVAEWEYVERRGWGKLSFTEFEEIYKRQEADGNRLDYLGSWIDFCIP